MNRIRSFFFGGGEGYVVLNPGTLERFSHLREPHKHNI